MRRSQRRGRVGGLRAQLLVGLIFLLMLTLALLALATVQFHNRHVQQAVADEARRHTAWLSELTTEQREPAAQALLEQPGILHVGPKPAGEQGPELAPGQAGIADFEDQSAIWAHGDDDLVVILSLSEAQAAIDAGRRALLVFLFSTLLFVTVVGYGFFSYVVIRPLRALSVATSRAAEGDLASPITLLPRNEFGDVGRQFNAMLERLDDQRAALEEKLEQLQKAHRELQQAQDSLVRSEKLASVGHLAAGIAHEVGNPLAAVMGYTEMLGDGTLDDEAARDLAERTLTQLRRIRKIIRQLLDYSRQDSQDEPTAVALSDCIDEALHLVRATPAARDIEIELDVPDDLPKVQAIAGEVVQVLVNLFLNAARAMADQPDSPKRLQISAAHRDDQVIVDVVDTGPGVDQEIADQIFDPFFTTGAPGDGTGLGLAIAHRLVTRVDGDLRLIQSDRGAHFQLRWKTSTSD